MSEAKKRVGDMYKVIAIQVKIRAKILTRILTKIPRSNILCSRDISSKMSGRYTYKTSVFSQCILTVTVQSASLAYATR